MAGEPQSYPAIRVHTCDGWDACGNRSAVCHIGHRFLVGGEEWSQSS